jgi:hypothetical protein
MFSSLSEVLYEKRENKKIRSAGNKVNFYMNLIFTKFNWNLTSAVAESWKHLNPD